MSAPDFTIADVLAWARTKPADEAYCYLANGECAIAQFLKGTGRAADPRVVPESWRDGFGNERHAYPFHLNLAAQSIWGGPATFGGLVLRLEQIASKPELANARDTGEFIQAWDFNWKRPKTPETPVTKSDWLAIDAYLTDIEQVDA